MLFFRYYLWLAPYTVCGAALLVCIRKGIWRRYPAFTALLSYYFVVDLPGTLILAFFFRQSIYRWFLVVDSVATFLLQLAVVLELSRELLLPRLLNRRLPPLPRWTAAALLLTAAGLAAVIPPTAQEHASNLWHVLSFGLNLILVGFLIAISLFSRLLGVSWSALPAGIVLGFGVIAATEMAASPLMAYMGRATYIHFDILRMVAFNICTVIWLIYVLLPDRPKPSRIGVQMPELERQLQELQKIIGK